jgi:aminoglycoside/choline kinase family phosphotransferase
MEARSIEQRASLSNLLDADGRLVWSDFEDTFRGPVHWDVASYAMSLRDRGADSRFVTQMLDAYGWADRPALARFVKAQELYGEIWRLYDAQRRDP